MTAIDKKRGIAPYLRSLGAPLKRGPADKVYKVYRVCEVYKVYEVLLRADPMAQCISLDDPLPRPPVKTLESWHGVS